MTAPVLDKPLINLREAAERLFGDGGKVRALRTEIDKGNLGPVRIAGTLYILPEDIENWKKREAKGLNKPPCVVYFIHCDGFIKIGSTTRVEYRLATLQVANPHQLDVLLVEDGGEKREAELHKEFAEYRVRGEWFRLEGRLRKYLTAQ